MHESHHAEEMKQQATGHPLWSERFETTSVVQQRWEREDKDLNGCVECRIEGVTRIFSWVPAFASFVRNQHEHGLRISHVRYIGHQDSIYARMTRYIADTSTPEEDRSIEYKINSKTHPLVKIKNT